MEKKAVHLEEIEGPGVRPPGGLVRSMAAVGQLVPVILWKRDGRYRIADGRRRVAAARRLGWTRVSAFILPSAEEAELAAARVTLAANIHSPNPLSEAEAVRVIGESEAKAVGLTSAQARHRARLARLHPEVREAIERGKIPRGAAGSLAKLPAERQLEALRRAMDQRNGKRVRIADIQREVRSVQASVQTDFLAHITESEPGRPDWQEYAVRAVALLTAIIEAAPDGVDVEVLRRAREELS